MSNKVLTISIAAYNAEEYLPKCLDSIVKCKKLEALDIIIIDDGSVDKTKDIAMEYVQKYPFSIKLISKENGGHGSTINTSIRMCAGRYYKVLDADDWIEPDNLDNLIDYLSKSDVDLVLNPFYYVDAKDGSKRICYPHHNEKDFEADNIPLDSIAKALDLYMHTFTIKSDLVSKMGPVIDENCFHVDVEYIVFPIEYITTVTVLSYPIYDYLLGTTSQSVDIKNMQKRRNQHLRVTKRLVQYYDSLDGQLSIEKKELILRRIVSLAKRQYIIYITMKPEEIKEELLCFDKWLSAHSEEIYRKVAEPVKREGIKVELFIWTMRKTQFLPYIQTVRIIDKLGLMKP